VKQGSLKNLYRDKEKVKEYWEETGAHRKSKKEFEMLKSKMLYDHTWAITVNAFIAMAGLQGDMKVLDAGCGWGRTVVGIKKKLPAIKMTGIDIIPGLLDSARHLVFEETGLNDSIFKIGDVQDLEFEDDSFDVVLSTRVLQYVQDPRKAVKEFTRVTKPGGRVVVILPNKLNPYIYLKYHTKIYSPLDIKRWFEKANLKIVNFGSLGYIPPFFRFKHYDVFVCLDKIIRKMPILRYFGGLAFCVGKKLD
jgi:ubiquinone/menaquinone biosynthesis C-methylase UbiE